MGKRNRTNHRRQHKKKHNRKKGRKQVISQSNRNSKYMENFSKFVSKITHGSSSPKSDSGTVQMHDARKFTPQYACHETTHIFSVGKCHIWIGKQADILRHAWDLTIQLTDSASVYRHDCGDIITANSLARSMLPMNLLRVCESAQINVEWDDFEVPQLPKAWWNNLLNWMQTRETDTSVGICCVGGHGRTGTFISVLAGLSGQTGFEGCPITWIRENYCDKAVESVSQMNYVHKMTGLKILAKPSWWDNKGAYSYSTTGRSAYTYDNRTNTYYADPYADANKPRDDEAALPTPTGAGVFRPVMNAAGDIIAWEKDYEVELCPDNPSTEKEIDYSNPDSEDFEDPDFDWEFYMEKNHQLAQEEKGNE